MFLLIFHEQDRIIYLLTKVFNFWILIDLKFLKEVDLTFIFVYLFIKFSFKTVFYPVDKYF